MERITKLFLRGLSAILPIALTVYLLYAVGKGAGARDSDEVANLLRLVVGTATP